MKVELRVMTMGMNLKTANKTFIKPSHVDIFPCGAMLKCDKCNFEANTQKNKTRSHKESDHFWCNICYSSFKNQEELKNHVQDTHSN